MKRLITIVVLMAMVAGCASSSMKSTPFYSGSERVYTGSIEDRVNLWPIGYYREPALSVLWPIFSMTDDHLAIRPIYSQFRQSGKDAGYDEFNFIWPFCQFDTKHNHHRIFPIFWGDKYIDIFPLVWWRPGKSFTLFPIVWWKENDYFNVFPLWWSSDNYTLLFPFYYQDKNTLSILPFYGRTYYHNGLTEWYGPYGWHRDMNSPEQNYDWCFPFYYHDATSFKTPLFGWDRSTGGSWFFPCYYDDDDLFLSAFYWRKWSTDDRGERTLSHGSFPFWQSDDEGFKSLFWVSHHDRLTNDDFWCVPPLLSWGSNGDDGWSQRYLLGLGGVEREKNGKYIDWIAPLYYKENNNFISLLYCHYEDEWGSTTNVTHVIPPLLSLVKSSNKGEKEMRFLFGLGGVNTTGNGDIDYSWLFPIYYKDDDSFISLLFAHEKDEFTSITPFIGVTHEEHKKGAWLWPLFGWTNDDRMEAAEEQMNADWLDPKIVVKKHEKIYSEGHTNRWYEVTGEVRAHDNSWRLSGLSTSDHWNSWHVSNDGKTVMAKDISEYGNIFAYKSERNRTIKFDVKTRDKLSDEETGESGIFCNILWHSKYEARKGRQYDMKSILWRFWHYEKLDGNVTVDSFPFFTYDSKTNGYSKTSLCWRLFRNEYDPKEDKRKVDVLFIPVWR